MIYAFGECLYDIVFRNHQPEWAVPGGSMLNAAVSAARAGQAVTLISEAGSDRVGDMLLQFLKTNGVTVDRIHRYAGNTTLAMAFIDGNGNASYQFYHHLPPEAPVVTAPDFAPGDVFMFGSFYALRPRNRASLKHLAVTARKAGARVIYDPNFRQAHLPQLDESMPYIAENIGMADIVRGSDEDFALIAGAKSPGDARQFVLWHGCSNLVLTRNREGAELFAGTIHRHYDALPATIISTIGAGDSFNAGIAARLNGVKTGEINGTIWDEAMQQALIFAAEVCGSRDNFISQRPKTTL